MAGDVDTPRGHAPGIASQPVQDDSPHPTDVADGIVRGRAEGAPRVGLTKSKTLPDRPLSVFDDFLNAVSRRDVEMLNTQPKVWIERLSGQITPYEIACPRPLDFYISALISHGLMSEVYLDSHAL